LNQLPGLIWRDIAVAVLKVQLHWLALSFEDAVRSPPAFMSKAKQPGGATGIAKPDVSRIRPYRRQKLRAFSHDAV
jgi:hypothetical protein